MYLLTSDQPKGGTMARLKTKPMALAGVSALARILLIDRFKPKPKPKKRRMRKIAKVAIPGLLALGAGGTIFKMRKGGAGKPRNFSLVGGAGPAPSSTNSQTRPETTPAKPTAPEASANKK
jgi:hypothetical protein